MLKRQIWFKTDLGYHATKEAILKSGIITGDGQDWKGILTFQLRKFKDVTIQTTTKGKLGITYPRDMDYNIILEKLRPLLVKADHTQAEIIKVIKEPSKPKDAKKLGDSSQKTPVSISTERYEKRLDSIRHENLSDPSLAYVDLLLFIDTLPSYIKNKVELEIQQATIALSIIGRNQSWQNSQMQERKKRIMSFVVLYFINKISALLYEQNEITASQGELIEFDSSFISWLEENKEKISEAAAETLKKALANADARERVSK